MSYETQYYVPRITIFTKNVYLNPAELLALTCSAKVKVTQSRPTLCDPMAYAVHGILLARILEADSLPDEPQGKPKIWEWVAFPSSRGSSQLWNVEDLGSISGLGRSPEEGKGYPLKDSGLEIPRTV